MRPEYTLRYAFTEPFPAGSGEQPVPGRALKDLPLGRQLLSVGNPTTAAFEKSLTALHNGRVWGMAAQDESRWNASDDISLQIANQANRFVLCYTEIGWANLMSDQSYIPLQPTQSRSLTGLVSTPSGLLVMFENEIFLITGDPAFGNVAVELYLDMVGCDVGAKPVKIGGVPFVIWGGKVWTIQAGQATEVGREQWLASDPFVRLAPEPQTHSLLALTESGLVFRYSLDDEFWLTDPSSRVAGQVEEMLPNCNCLVGENTRFVTVGRSVHTTRRDGSPDVPFVYWEGLDWGAFSRRTALHLLKAGVEGPVSLAGGYASGVSASSLPHVFYRAQNESNASSGLEVVGPVSGSPVAARRHYPGLVGGRPRAALHWRFPLRRLKGEALDVRLVLAGFSYGDALRLPGEFVVSVGGQVE